MLRYLYIDCRRIFYRGNYLWSVLIVIFLCAAGSYDELIGVLMMGGNTCLPEVFDSLTVFESFRLIAFLPACYFGGWFACEDWKSGFIKFLLIRGNEKNYIIARILLTIISAFSIIVLGMVIYAGLLKGLLVIMDAERVTYTFTRPYVMVGYYFGEFGYVVLLAVLNGMAASLFAMTGLLISLFSTDKWIALLMPLISFYYVSEFGRTKPEWNVYSLCANFDIIGKGAIKTFIYAVSFFSVSIGIMIISYIFVYMIRRKKKLW